jgi:hypothetical protein
MSDRFTFRALAPAARPTGRPDYTEILPQLFIGEYPTPEDAGWLKSTLGADAVLCLQDDSDLHAKFLRLSELRNAYAAEDVDFHRVAIPDGDGVALAAAIDQIVGIVHDLIAAGKRVYVHCNAGMNRAPTVAIAYLHVHAAMTLSDARDLVKERRMCLPYMTVLEARYGAKSAP